MSTHTSTIPGDELIAALSPRLDVVVDESGCIVLRCGPDRRLTRVTVSDVGALAQALLEARLVVEARDQGYDRRLVEARPESITQWCDRSWHDGDCCDGSRREWASAHTTNPVCGARPYPAGSEGDDGTECLLPAGHAGHHDDMPEGDHDGHVSCTPEGCVLR